MKVVHEQDLLTVGALALLEKPKKININLEKPNNIYINLEKPNKTNINLEKPNKININLTERACVYYVTYIHNITHTRSGLMAR